VRGASGDSSLHLKLPQNAVRKPTVPIASEQGTPTVQLQIEGVSRRLILDTGSNVSILQPGVSQSEVKVTAIRPYGVTGEDLDVKGQKLVSFWLGEHEFLVCTLPMEAAGLLGTDFLRKTGSEINLECGKMTLTSIDDAPQVYSVTHTKSAALTVFTGEKADRSPQPTRIEEPRLDVQPPATPRSEMATPKSKS
jgi:hypothetical protein